MNQGNTSLTLASIDAEGLSSRGARWNWYASGMRDTFAPVRDLDCSDSPTKGHW
jgi:hypothetical protein